MDEDVSALDVELRRLFDEACGVTATMRKLGAPGTKPQASELSKAVNGTCKQMRMHLRNLEQLAEEQETADASLQVEQLVKEHKLQYEKLKSELESALAEMKKNSELAWRKQRQELLSGGTTRTQIKDDRTAVAATEGITESLRRTRQLMSEQIGAADANTQLIGNSTSVLGKTKDELQSQKRLFRSSRRLLSTMSWYDVLDKIVLYGGVGFFLIVVVYILQKRMLGLTPEFIKLSISGFVNTSLDRAKEYYQQPAQPSSVPEDPVKAPLLDVDHPDEVEQGDLIKAVREEPEESSVSFTDIDPGEEEPKNSEEDVKEEEQGFEEKQEPLDDHSEEIESQHAPVDRTTDPLQQQETIHEVSTTTTEVPEKAIDEDRPHLVIPTHQETTASQNREAEEEDIYLDVELDDPVDQNKDEL